VNGAARADRPEVCPVVSAGALRSSGRFVVRRLGLSSACWPAVGSCWQLDSVVKTGIISAVSGLTPAGRICKAYSASPVDLAGARVGA
jgi:hypothetical protein